METIVVSLISNLQRSRFILELLIIVLCQFRVFKYIAWTLLLLVVAFYWFNGRFLQHWLFLCDFFWWLVILECWTWLYVRSHWFGCSLLPETSLPWKLASCILGGHWPYLLRSYNWFCFRTNAWWFSTLPWLTISPFFIKLACLMRVICRRTKWLQVELDFQVFIVQVLSV